MAELCLKSGVCLFFVQAEPEAFGSVSEAERIQKIRRIKLPSFNSKTSFLLSSLSERAPVKRFPKSAPKFPTKVSFLYD